MKLWGPMEAWYSDFFNIPPRISFKSSHIPKSSHILGSELSLPNPQPVIQPVLSLTLPPSTLSLLLKLLPKNKSIKNQHNSNFALGIAMRILEYAVHTAYIQRICGWKSDPHLHINICPKWPSFGPKMGQPSSVFNSDVLVKKLFSLLGFFQAASVGDLVTHRLDLWLYGGSMEIYSGQYWYVHLARSTALTILLAGH